MVGERVSVVTARSHTTRRSVRGVCNIGETQLVFTDTPGVVSYQEARRLRMHRDHMRTPQQATAGADMIAVVVDSWNKYTRTYIDDSIINMLNEHLHIPSVLILNKVDKVKRTELLPLANTLNKTKRIDQKGFPIGGWDQFDQSHYVSASYGHGVDILLNYFVENARMGAWEFDAEVYSDASYDAMISEVLREKLLTMVGQEIPWQVKQQTLVFTPEEDSGKIRIIHQLSWPRVSQQRYLMTMKDELELESTKILEKMFQCEVDLKLIISQKNKILKDDVHYS